MQMPVELKDRCKLIASLAAKVEIQPDFWNASNMIWQNTNNHVMLMMRNYYYVNETDPEFKEIFGPMLDKFVWLYVCFPEWRARLGWMSWFLQMYIIDKQIIKEQGPFNGEVWNDPRKWGLATKVENPIQVDVTKAEEDNGCASGLATKSSH